MRSDKRSRMMAGYDGHKGPVTVDAVAAGVPAVLWDRLTGAELGAVMSAVNAAYHHGKADAGAEIVDGDCVWMRGKLIPLTVIDALRKTDTTVRVLKSAHGRQTYETLTDAKGVALSEGELYRARSENNKGAYYIDTRYVTTWDMQPVVERM